MREESGSYTRQRKKELGVFYSPKILADFMASTLLSYYKGNKDQCINVVDPSTGDSILLSAFSSRAARKGIRARVFGVDIDEAAIKRSYDSLSKEKIDVELLNTDALYPLNESTPQKGWSLLKELYLHDGIHFFVSNPPWGADISKYENLLDDFQLASGQFDIYDLFIEMMISNLNEGGYYGFIVPDSIYSKEHTLTRKKLFQETTIKQIVRLGEGFFPDVNMAVSLIFGIKSKRNHYKIKCSHISNKEKKNVLSGKTKLQYAIRSCQVLIPSKIMIENGYSFITDVDNNDSSLFGMLSACRHFSDFSITFRGVELSKKGNIVKCHKCGKWLPLPRWKDQVDSKCPHCGSVVTKDSSLKVIVSNNKEEGSAPLIVGEDIYRYITVPTKNIALNYKGINYKDSSLYQGSKVLIRKTGIGLTAGIDYNNCYVNQVVFILRRKDGVLEAISNEVLLAILNSRIMTYYYVKKYGGTGWKSHPYISQEMIGSLPFPIINAEDKSKIEMLQNITELVRHGLQTEGTSFSSLEDAKIERIVASLFEINKESYKVIFETLQKVQQMIPFKRLLNISIEDIFNHGL